MSLQLSCNDTCQIWTWYFIRKPCLKFLKNAEDFIKEDNSFSKLHRATPWLLFTNTWSKMSYQQITDLTKSQSCKIWSWHCLNAIKFDRCLSSNAAKATVKFQSDMGCLTPSLTASKPHEIWRYNILVTLLLSELRWRTVTMCNSQLALYSDSLICIITLTGLNIFLRKHKNRFAFCTISQNWDGGGIWNSSQWKTRICLSFIVNSKVADDLATWGARSSATMVLT